MTKRKKRPRTKKEPKYFSVYLPLYRCSVVVTWGTSIPEIEAFCKRNKVSISKSWKKEAEGAMEEALGLVMNLGDGNPDVMVWLKYKPKKRAKLKAFGTVFHEVHHAVDAVLTDHNMRGERESAAYLYEYLVVEIMKKFSI